MGTHLWDSKALASVSFLGGGRALWRLVESEAFLKERALQKGWSCSSPLEFSLDFRVEETLGTA